MKNICKYEEKKLWIMYFFCFEGYCILEVLCYMVEMGIEVN